MLYALRAGDVGGPIKIGYTGRSRYARADELQVGNHEELHVVATCQGTREDETLVKQLFEWAQIRGEWFHPVPQLLAHIADWRPSLDHFGDPWIRVAPPPVLRMPRPPDPSISAEAFADAYLKTSGRPPEERESDVAWQVSDDKAVNDLAIVRGLALWLGAPRDVATTAAARLAPEALTPRTRRLVGSHPTSDYWGGAIMSSAHSALATSAGWRLPSEAPS